MKIIYGWAQLRPIGSSVKDPEQYDALDGSGSIEKEIDEEIWEDFESEEVAFPNGFASLPWTKEYREYSKSSEKRRKRRKYLIEQSEQQKKRGQNQLWELASVYVFPEYRKEGIGSELVNRIIQEHAMLDRRIGDIYLLTLDGTKDWYRRFGFEVTNNPPASMAYEFAAGKVITTFLGQTLVAMQGVNRMQ